MRGVYEKVKGSNEWYISYFDSDGRHHRQHVGRQSAAIEAYVNKKREIREGKFISPAAQKSSGATLDQVFKLRMAAKERELTDQTARAYRALFASPRFDGLRNAPIRKIRAADIDEVLNAVHRDRRSKDTQKNYRALMSGIFSYALAEDLVAANPVKKTKAPKASKGRTRFLSADEEKAMRAKIRQLWPEREAELDLLLQTGMRVGEAWHLTWDRVHPDRSVIEVPKEGKTGERDVPMSSSARKALEILHEQSGGSRFVIANAPGKMDEDRTDEGMRYWARSFRKLAEKAGVDEVTAHTLRHTFASRLAMAGVSVPLIQRFLGHTTIMQTMRYAHLAPECGQAEIELLVAPAASAPATAEADPKVVKIA
jgi:integrase